MAETNLKMWRIIFITIFFNLISCNYNILKVHANSMVPCYFIFGDSLSDPGNNNGLKTKAKTNYKPYGIDYPGSVPTGRFTNGRTAVDFIAEHLGFEQEIVGYSNAKGDEILKGVNYASGAAGIRPESGSHLGERISLEVQLSNHKNRTTKLNAMLNGTAGDYLTKCVYTVNIGSNDYINNYFLPKYYPESQKYGPLQYANALVTEYSKQLKALYESGARKIAVFGLGPIGCTIAEGPQSPIGIPCVSGMNAAVSLFNLKLISILPKLTSQLHNATFTYINTEVISIVGPLEGVFMLTEPCCEVRDDYQCKEGVAPCDHRDIYYFFDGFHPTEAVNKVTGRRAFSALTHIEAFPYDISTLAKL